MLAMWENDIKICHEHRRVQGYHLFHCDIHAFYALRDNSYHLRRLGEAGTEQLAFSDRVYASRPGCPNMMWKEDLQLWRHWTTCGFFSHDVDASHTDMKMNQDM